jgi:hypothetical protein
LRINVTARSRTSVLSGPRSCWLTASASRPGLGLIAGLIFNAFIAQRYQSVAVHVGPGFKGNTLTQVRIADSISSILWADRILGLHGHRLALRHNVGVTRLMSSNGVGIVATVMGNPVAAERDASAVAHGYLRYLSCGWPRSPAVCRPMPPGTGVARVSAAHVWDPLREVPPRWVRFGLYGLVAGVLLGLLTLLVRGLVRLVRGVVRLNPGRSKGPVRQLQ